MISKAFLLPGLYLGIAISSMFLLKFGDSIWGILISFLLMFLLLNFIIANAKKYREELPNKTFNLKSLLWFTFQFFVIGALVSSAFKFIYLTYIKPDAFRILVPDFFELIELSIIEMYENFVKINWGINLKIPFTPLIYAWFGLVNNIIFGLFIGRMLWPMFRKEQEIRSSTKS